MRRAGGEVQNGGENISAGALGANESTRNMEVVLRQQLVEIVAGDAARDARKLFADESGVAVAEACKSAVDLADAATTMDERVKTFGRRGSDRHTRAVVENDIERFDVVNDFAAEQAVHAATVVANHATEGAAGVRGRIGRVGELMELGGIAQPVENDSGLNAGEPLRGVQFLKRIHETRKVKDNSDIDALAGEAGTRAARENGSTCGAAGGQCGLNVGCVAWKNDADGKLAVVRRIGSVKSARARIEAHFAANRFLQKALKLPMSRKALMTERR